MIARISHRTSNVLAVLSILTLLHCSDRETSPSIQLPSHFPVATEIAGWEAEDDPQVFEGEDLWSHINGGAEIYHEYGFVRVYVQEYTNKVGSSLIVESYEMLDAFSAYGICSFKTGREGMDLNLTHGGLLEDYYLNFWKDRFAVTITAFDSEIETIDALEAFAQIIDRKIAAPGEKPQVVSLIPEEGLKKHSVKYLKGNLGLFNTYAFATTDIFGFSEAVKAGYHDGYDLYLLSYPNEERSGERYRNATEFLQTNPKYRDFKTEQEFTRATDENGTLLYMKPLGRYICIVLGADGEDAATRIVGGLQLERSEATP
jgi:hypothetical protein